jgi:hypothetical protein
LQEGEPEWVEALLAGQPITNRAVYAGFTATVSALPSGDSYQFFAAFSIINGPRPLSRVVITTQDAAPGKFRIGVTHRFTGTGGLPAPTGIIPVDLSLNTPFRLVLRQGLPSPLSTVWVNPTTEEGGADNSDEGTFLPASIVGFMFRQRLLDGQGMGTVTVDDLVVATTFDEVKSAPVPPPNLSGIRLDASGGVRFTLKGAAGSPFTLERSTDLLRWETWIEGTLQEADAAGREFLDDSTNPTTQQFYRARSE